MRNAIGNHSIQQRDPAASPQTTRISNNVLLESHHLSRRDQSKPTRKTSSGFKTTLTSEVPWIGYACTYLVALIAAGIPEGKQGTLE